VQLARRGEDACGAVVIAALALLGPDVGMRCRYSLKRKEVAMSEPEAHSPASYGASRERSREGALAAARPLPPHEEMITEDLTEDEDRIFLDAILNA
jgi:hypothetical protein